MNVPEMTKATGVQAGGLLENLRDPQSNFVNRDYGHVWPRNRGVSSPERRTAGHGGRGVR